MHKSTNWYTIHFAYEWCRQGRLDCCRQWIGILLCSCLWALSGQFLSQLCNLKLQLLHLLNQINRLRHFFLKISTRGDSASSKNSNFQGYTQQYAVVEQATNVLYRYQRQDKQNQSSWNQM